MEGGVDVIAPPCLPAKEVSRWRNTSVRWRAPSMSRERRRFPQRHPRSPRSLRLAVGLGVCSLAVVLLSLAWRVTPVESAEMMATQTSEVEQLRRDITSLRKDLEDVRRQAATKKKDSWDKVSAVSGLTSGILVALIGGLFTYYYNKQQRRTQEASEKRQQRIDAIQHKRELALSEIQTLEKFLPLLKSNDEREKEAGLLAIGALDSLGGVEISSLPPGLVSYSVGKAQSRL
jgi:hypothetical protein